MNLLKQLALSAYYTASQPARRRAAKERAASQTEPVRVLFYHRVADQHPNDWTMSRAKFAAQINWLRKRFDVVSLGQAQERIASGCNSVPTACITFDDGYAENMDFAIPLLLEQRLPFTYFVTTRNVLTGKPFPHDVEAGQPLTPNTVRQLRQMAAAGVEIGAHTCTHADLGRNLSHRELVDEIVACKQQLEVVIDREVRYFAFPFGMRQNLSADAFQVAYEAGYRGVVSAYGGYNFPGDDPFHLRRFHADSEIVRFKNWLTIDPRKQRAQSDFDAGDYRRARAPEPEPPFELKIWTAAPA